MAAIGAATAGAFAAGSSTSVHAQADVPSARNQTYAELGDWIVEFVPAERQRQVPAFCQLTRVYDQGVQLRIVSGNNFYAIDFQGRDYLATNAKRFDLEYAFDGPNSQPRRTTADLITDGEGFDWIRIVEPAGQPGSSDEMMNARQLTIRSMTDNRRWPYQVNGSNRAMNSLFDCRDEKVLGQPRRRAPAPVAQPVPQFVPAPQFQAPPPPPPVRQASINPAYCNEYGILFAEWARQALAARCPGWAQGHLSAAGNAAWCMKQSFATVEKAKVDRSGMLQGCLASRPGGPAPQQAAAPRGRDQSRHPICSSFAKHAERWDNAAKAQGCRISNDKNERQYYEWCQGTSDADFRQRSPVAGGHKAGREKECSAQLRRPVRL